MVYNIGFCEALKENDNFLVYGTSRIVPNDKLIKMGVNSIFFKYDSISAIDSCLEKANPDYVIFITDFNNAANANIENEIRHGKIIIDALKKHSSLKHVIFSSGYRSDIFPDLCKSKLIIEDYLRKSGLSFSILRPGSFFENFDDASTFNPLKKGQLRGLFSTKIQYISCYDTGKAAVTMLKDRDNWNGKTLDCVSFEGTGSDCAEALSRASNVPCKFHISMSPTFLWFLSFIPIFSFLYKMVLDFGKFNESGSRDIIEFKKIVPSPLDAEAFFRKLGKWNNGEKF